MDGKPVHTPAGLVLTVPSRALAEALAAEWQAQGEKIRPETMPLFRLACTALDKTPREETVRALLASAETDTLCYRAEHPAALAQQQAAQWQPVLAWAQERFGVSLAVTAGVSHRLQPPEALEVLEKVLSALDNFTLCGVQQAASLTGSVILALALAEGHLSADQVFSLAFLDELFQTSQWGEDPEATRRRQDIRTELEDTARFLFSVKR